MDEERPISPASEPTPQPFVTPSPGIRPAAPDSAVASATPPDWLTRLLLPAYESKTWLRFLGVVSIVGGALTALTIVGLIVAWLYVWVGVLLWQAGDRAGQAYLQKDVALFEQFLQKLKTLITIAGVATVLSLAVGVLALLIAVPLGLMGILAGRLGM
jgi:hypothetical protein